MTMYVWPTDVVPFAASFYKQHHSTVFESPLTRTQQVLGRAGDRYVCDATFNLPLALAGKLDGFLAKVKGPQNTVEAWTFHRPHPTASYWNTEPTDYLTLLDFSDGTDFTDNTQMYYERAYAPIVLSRDPVMFGGFAQNANVINPGDFVSINDVLYVIATSADSGPDGEVGVSLPDALVADYGDVITLDRPKIEMRITSDDAGSNMRSMQQGDGFVVMYNISFVEVLT